MTNIQLVKSVRFAHRMFKTNTFGVTLFLVQKMKEYLIETVIQANAV